MNRKETNVRENKHKIELIGHELTVEESTYTHNNEENIDTVVRIASNDKPSRSVSIHIDDNGTIVVFTSGLGVNTRSIQKRTRNLGNSKYVVLSSKYYDNDFMDKIFIDV